MAKLVKSISKGNMNNKKAVQEGLFTLAQQPCLLGSRCADCGEHFFPATGSCSHCSGQDLENVELGDSGILWSWTIQGFRPKEPFYGSEDESFNPYGVGYVELPCGLKVESRLLESDPESLEIGMPMELVLESLYIDDDGREVVTFAFAAAGEARA